MTTQSTLKATQDGFNNMPTKQAIATVLATYNLEPVDIEKNYWQNAEDTVVVITKAGMTAFEATNMTIALTALDLDEIHAINEDGRIIIRMWWD